MLKLYKMDIKITNKRILSFFEQRPDMDFESMILKFIDIMESLNENMNKTLTNTTVLEILDNITDDIFIPITISGGIRSVDDIRKLLLIGADKVAINTSAINNPSFINEAVSFCGSQSVAISIQTKFIDNEWF